MVQILGDGIREPMEEHIDLDGVESIQAEVRRRRPARRRADSEDWPSILSAVPIRATGSPSIMRKALFVSAVLLALATGSPDVVAQGQQPAADGPDTGLPPEFQFLLHSVDQRTRDTKERGAGYLDDHWKRMPFESISLERGSTGGCLISCGGSTITLHNATNAGVFTAVSGLRGRAELRREQADMNLQKATVSEFEETIDLYTYASLSYLLHKVRFLELPDRYDSDRARFDVPFTTVTVVADGKTKSVTDYGEGRPIELWAVQQTLDAVSTRIPWKEKK